MFALNSFSDVVAVAKTFGPAALRHVTEKHTISMEAERRIFDCMKWAASTVIEIDNVNDGNIEYSVDAVFTSEKVAGVYYTGLDEITIIRQGFGSYTVTVREAMAKGYITKEQLSNVISIITARNEAATAFEF